VSPPVFDALGPSATGSVGTGTSPLGWNHTVSASPSRLLLVWCAFDSCTATVAGAATATKGGVATAMTSMGTVFSGGITAGYIQGWYIYNPDPGTCAVSVSWTGTSPSSTHGGSLSFTNVSMIGTPVLLASAGSVASGSISVLNTSGGNLVACGITDGSDALVFTGSATSRINAGTVGSGAAGNIAASTLTTGGGTATTSWTQTSDDWAAIAVEVQAAGGQFARMPQQMSRVSMRNRKRTQMQQWAIQSPNVAIAPTVVTATASIPAASPVPQYPYITQILGTGTAQHWGDQSGHPIMMISDTPWALAFNAGQSGGATTVASDITAYCSARQAQGFNCFLIAGVGTSQIDGANNFGNTWDGVAPFTGPGVLNNTYWTRVDLVISTALQYGLTVILNPMFTYAISDTGGAMSTWTNANFTTYGTALGTRYKSALNLLWEFGDDYGGGYDTAFTNCLTAIRAAGDTHLFSVENETRGDSRSDIAGGGTYAFGTSYAQYNWDYGYGCAYNCVEFSYQESSPLLVMKMDGQYGQAGDSRLFWRTWALWSLSSGSRGFQMGRNDIFRWPSGVVTGGVLTSMVTDNTDFAIWKGIFTALPEWYLLVPDTSSALVTAGRGTRSLNTNDTYPPADVGTNTYVTASMTADGTLAVVYNPSAASQTVTINTALLATGWAATWIDPTNGAKTSAGTGPTFTHSAANALGDPDWLLVFQTGGPATGAAAGAGAVTAVATVLATAAAAGAGSVTALVTEQAPAAAAGAGSVTAKVTQQPAGAAASAGAVTALAVQQAPATAAGAGVATAAVNYPGTASVSGAGSAAGLATQAAPGTSAGTGAVTDAAAQGAPATAAGAGSVTAVATVQAPASAAGAGSTGTDPVTQAVIASAAGAGSVTAAGSSSGAATASIAGAGATTAVVTQAVIAAAAGAGSATALAVQAAGSAAAGAGAATAVATQAVTGSAAGAGAVAAVAAQIAGAAAAGAGAVADTVTQVAPGTAAGAGSVADVATQAATATAAGAGAVSDVATQAATATAAGAGAVTDVATQIAVAAAAGAGAVTAGGGLSGSGTASIAGAGSATAAVTQAATGAATGAGTAAVAGTQAAPGAAAGAGAAAGTATQAAPAAAGGAGSATAMSAQAAIASAAGAGSVTAAGSVAGGPATGAAAGAGAASGTATQGAVASAAGTSAVTAAGQAVVTGTASAAGAGSATAGVVQAAGAQAAGAGAVAARTVQIVIALAAGSGAVLAVTYIVPIGATGTVAWTAHPAPPRWTAAPAPPRWHATPAPPRWKAVLMNFAPIAAISLEEININWTSDLAGTEVDPTGVSPGSTLLTVQFAVPVSSGNPLAPATPVTWYTATWLLGANIRGYIAQGLVGPTSMGGLVQLTAGVSYDVHGQVLGVPEQPRKFAGTISAY